MIRSGTLIFLLILHGMIFGLPTAGAQEDGMILESPLFEGPRRPPVYFSHDAHNEAAQIDACNECHHVFENGNLVENMSSEDQLCGDCHGNRAQGARPGLRRAFHNNCKGCHLTQKMGPVMCGQCHVRMAKGEGGK